MSYVPLFPLALLMVTGVYLFAYTWFFVPYAGRRGGRQPGRDVKGVQQ